MRCRGRGALSSEGEGLRLLLTMLNMLSINCIQYYYCPGGGRHCGANATPDQVPVSHCLVRPAVTSVPWQLVLSQLQRGTKATKGVHSLGALCPFALTCHMRCLLMVLVDHNHHVLWWLISHLCTLCIEAN